jgi:hypothetical protein
MSVGLLDQTMTTEKSEPPSMSVRLPLDIIRTARVVTSFRGGAMSDLLADILRPILEKMKQEEIAKDQASGKRRGK